MNNRWHDFTVDPENKPLPRAGVYLFRYLPTGECYVGAAKNVEKRCAEHSRGGGNVPLFSEFLNRHLGRGEKNRRHLFEVVPLWFSIHTGATKKTAGTHAVEQSMIVAYDSINHGWNRPHPEVGLLCKTTEAIAKRIVTEASADTQRNRSNGAVRRWSTRATTYTYNGETHSLKEWAKITGIPYQTLYWRHSQGWSDLLV